MVFFDLDGTLLDSNGIWLDIDIAFLGRHGISPVPEDYTWYVTHHSAPDSARYTRERFGLAETAEEIQGAWLDMAREAYAHRLPLKPGARALLGRPYSRRVELTHGENEWSLRLLDEEKQGLPAGKYRCVFSAGEQSLPVTVLLNGETDGRLLLSGEEPSLQKSLNEGRGRLFFWQAAK